ncbi:hypothetical protein [Plantactinospora endophytica]|nr:hypothetical protein [Plantactinospora endophytica]
MADLDAGMAAGQGEQGIDQSLLLHTSVKPIVALGRQLVAPG